MVTKASGGRSRDAAIVLAEEKGRHYPGEGAMTVAELIEKLSGISDKTARVCEKSRTMGWLERTKPNL